MKPNILLIVFVISVISLARCQKGTLKDDLFKRSNILLIIADDLGYTDLGCYGSEINTPHIDALADSGLRLSSLCTAPTCSPACAMLLSGVVAHRNGFGTMAGDWSVNLRGQRGYEGHLNFDVVTFPRLLQDAGYHTSIAGKWLIIQFTQARRQSVSEMIP